MSDHDPFNEQETDRAFAVATCAAIFLVCFLVAGEHVFFSKEEIHNGIFLEDESPGGSQSGSSLNGMSGMATQPRARIKLEDGRRVFATYDRKLGPKLPEVVRVKELRGGITGRPRFYVLPLNANAD